MFVLWFAEKAVGVLRTIGLWLDTISFSFIDNIYNIFVALSKAQIFDSNIVETVIHNIYVLIGVFAMFRIALFLITSIINPDNLNKQGEGLSKIFVNTVIMIVLLISMPQLFDLSREFAADIVDNQYIQKIFLNVEDTSISDMSPGKDFQRIALGSLLTVNSSFVDESGKPTCGGDCKKAVECINNISGLDTENGTECMNDNEVKWTVVDKYNGVKEDGQYVYDYKPFLLTITGWFITYVLFSFTFDVAKRVFELLVLEILSPIFIATIVDPKSMKTGMFKKWLKAFGTSYAGLFLRIAAISLLLLLMKILMQSDLASVGLGGLGKLILLMGLLIFMKQFPKWIGDMTGLGGEGSGLGGLGISKKLAGAAGIGGLIGSATQKARDGSKRVAKNFAANRLRNTASRIGGAKEQIDKNRDLKKEMKKNGGYNRELYKNNRGSIYKAQERAKAERQAANRGQEAQGVLKDFSIGYMTGRQNIDPNAKTLKDAYWDKIDAKNQKLNSPEDLKKKMDYAKDAKEARGMYKNVSMDPSYNGDRLKVKGPSGKDVYLNPVGSKEMNEAFNSPATEYSAYAQFGRNMLTHINGTEAPDGKLYDADGKFLANSAAEYGLSNMDYKGRLAVKSLVADNVSKDVSNYQQALQQKESATSTFTSGLSAYNDARVKLSSTEYQNASSIMSTCSSNIALNDAASNISKIVNNADYIRLSNKAPGTLTSAEQVSLTKFQTELENNETVKSTELSKLGIDENTYDNSKQIVERTNEEVTQMKSNYEESKKRLEAWSKEVSKFETKFANTRAYEIDDNGKLTGKEVNPYEVSINGQKVVPGPNSLIKLQEINDILNTKASKASEAYKTAKEEKKDK